jgi:hypothetical protein
VTTWLGWAGDFLAAASLPNTANSRKFLNDWATNANFPSCGDNPIDLSHKEPGSTNCGGTTLWGDDVQRYTSHTWARTAFNSQIHSSRYAAILAALRSGNPYTVKNPGSVATQLGEWSSTDFANIYLNEAQSGPPTPITAPRAHKGWADMRRSVNHHWGAALAASDHEIRAALRSLSHARKVKL